jgi:ribosome-associated protein
MNLDKEIWFEFTRSRGPGGQHVNKTNSAAILHWHLESSNVFSEDHKKILTEKLANYINSEGFILIRCDQFRDQAQNKKGCLNKFQELVKAALHRPKKRIKTKPSRSSVRRRVESKKFKGETKKLRNKIDF